MLRDARRGWLSLAAVPIVLAAGVWGVGALAESNPSVARLPRPSATTTVDTTDPEDAAASSLPSSTTPVAPIGPDRSANPVAPTTTAPNVPRSVLVWALGEVSPELVSAVSSAGSVAATSMVLGGEVGLVQTRSADGAIVDELTPPWRIPFDVIGVEPDAHAGFMAPPAAAAIAGIAAGQGLLTETSAELRRVGPGSVLRFTTGAEVQIVGIIDDVSGAGSELVVTEETAVATGLSRTRFLLARPTDSPEATAAELQQQLGSEARVRIDRPYLRHGDAVLPLAQIKARFGEFSFRPTTGRAIEMDPRWVEQHIVEVDLPILGPTRCHREFAPVVADVLSRLELAGQAGLVDPGGFAGCWSPRRQSAVGPVSRHAFGVAMDLNIGANPRGDFATQDEILVTRMQEAGLGWGGVWLNPDPGHYEWVGPSTA